MVSSSGTYETASSFSFCSLDTVATSFSEDSYELELQWGRIERPPTIQRVRMSLLPKDGNEEEREVIDVTNLGALERHVFIEKLITKVEEDKLRLLKKLRERIDGVGLELPTIEVRYQNLCVEAECEVVHGKPLPTLWNSLKGLFSAVTNVSRCNSQQNKVQILKDVSGIIKPSRFRVKLNILHLRHLVNEFLAPRWQKVSSNGTLGHLILRKIGLNLKEYYYWISVAALIGFWMIFNIVFTIALSYLKPPGKSRAIVSLERFSYLKGIGYSRNANQEKEPPSADTVRAVPETKTKTTGMVLPFKPKTLTFKNVEYFVDTPKLLQDITGAFRPQVLTALMGVSGAGKTTLMDVLCGRKTGGYIEGEIRIEGYHKVHETFARVSGYCERTDIHSPQLTIQESVMYSAWLRLPMQIDKHKRLEFVAEVLQMIELDEIKDSLVGIPGVSGLSLEQRKRLTIAVELISNPSIIFMDEPTSGFKTRCHRQFWSGNRSNQ